MKGGGATKSISLIESATCSVIIGIGARPLVVEEVGRIERRRNRVEGERRLREVETIRQIIGRSVRVAERWEVERRLDEFQDAAEVMGDVRDVRGLRVPKLPQAVASVRQKTEGAPMMKWTDLRGTEGIASGRRGLAK